MVLVDELEQLVEAFALGAAVHGDVVAVQARVGAGLDHLAGDGGGQRVVG